TLRVHADRAGCTTIGWHPRCHLDLWEEQAATHLHGLVPRRLGSVDAVLTRADLDDVTDPLGAILWELPQRELGGVLPEWDDLVAQVDWARDRGIATHLDGARLWMVPPHYDRDLAAVAGLFDTVYVSMYKDLGGLPGCVLAGPDDLLARVRTWRHRHGGRLHAMWPQAASGLAGLRRHLPRMADYAAHARALAGAVSDVDGVHVVPDPPQTSMFHLWLDVDPTVLERRLVAWSRQSELATWIGPDPAPLSGWSVLEVSVGDATMDVDPTEFRDLVDFMSTGQDRSD
ncbi:MAG TPA: beta-eliminating lyase-related protein, partial [Nitriliruptoraceae bacterium]|nr:beta-eliminating lyase-related protein [Nitriliruptoraceae bacterium]